MPRKKIKKTETTQSFSGIKLTPISTSPKGVSFSYKYFQGNHDKFSAANRKSEYLIALLERLRDISSWTAQELTSNRSSTLRCHSIIWEDTTESCFDFPREEELVDTPYQFSLSSNEHGRVHGFFIEEVFFIVWLDPDHNLYS